MEAMKQEYDAAMSDPAQKAQVEAMQQAMQDPAVQQQMQGMSAFMQVLQQLNAVESGMTSCTYPFI